MHTVLHWLRPKNTMILPRARLRIVRVLSRWSTSTKEEQGGLRVLRDDHKADTTGPFPGTSYSSNSSTPAERRMAVLLDGMPRRQTSAPLLPSEKHAASGLLPKALTS